jgi:hypothetical protein
MSIVSVGIEPGYPEVGRQFQGGRVTRSSTYRLKVITDDPNETGVALEQAIFLAYPQWAVGYDLGSGFTIRTSRLKRSSENRKLHFLELSADDQVTDKEKEDKDKPPDQRRTEWSWDFETLEFALTQDVDGQVVATTAGDPFEVTYPIAIPVVTIERQQASFDPNTIISYVNHVNDASFWGAPVGSVLCAGIRERKGETFNGVEYRAVSYVFKFAVPEIPGVMEGWKLKVLNNGPTYILGGEQTACREDSTTTSAGTGSKVNRNITAGGTGLIDPGDPPHILSFKQFKEADFGALNLNWPL